VVKRKKREQGTKKKIFELSPRLLPGRCQRIARNSLGGLELQTNWDARTTKEFLCAGKMVGFPHESCGKKRSKNLHFKKGQTSSPYTWEE